MGIKLDWQIEADQTQQRDQEDPKAKRRRRRIRTRMVMLSVLIAVVVCAVVGFVLWRLQAVEQSDENALRASVEAEFAAIRIGSEREFMALQRSPSQQFLDNQQVAFQNYQTLKQEGRYSPDSSIVDIEIDGQRGRVIIHETIDGITHQRAWFYWRYEPTGEPNDLPGWRHVPADVTFWGDEDSITEGNVEVIFNELDANFAKALAEDASIWWDRSCELLACATAPNDLTIVIDANAGLRHAWEPDDGWQLRIISPLVGDRVAVDNPITSELEAELATLLAERLIRHVSGERLQYPAGDNINFDTTWLKIELRDWLVARLLQQEAPFFDSLVNNFGTSVPGTIAATLNDQSDINAIAPIFGVGNLSELPTAQLDLIDWRDFFQWRLELERQRLLDADEAGFFALYENQFSNASAQARLASPTYRGTTPETITAVTMTFRNDGALVALANAEAEDGTRSAIQFVWTGQTFVRAD